jgi:anti-anti-sigma factor
VRVAASSDCADPGETKRTLHGDQSPLEVLVAREGTRTRVQLRGELDIATVGAVANRLAALRERRETVLLDLDELTFIDASGIRLVVDAAEDSRRDGWAFAVTHGSWPVRRVLQLLELDQHLPYDGRTR